jgi:hypothetical protein
VKQFYKDDGTFEENTEDIEIEYSPETNTKSYGYMVQNGTPRKQLFKVDKVIFENSTAIPNFKSKKLFNDLKINTFKNKR